MKRPDVVQTKVVAAFAAGGVKALAAVQHSAGAARLLLQLR